MKSEHSLVKNAVLNIVYRLLNVIFPLATSIYVSRILLSAGVGRVSFALNIVSYFVLFSSLGISSYGPRELGKAKDTNARDKIVSELILINFISSMIFSFIYILLILTISKFRDDFLLYIVAGIQLFLNFINVDWVYQGLEEYGYITIRNLIVKIVSFVSIILFVKNTNHYLIYALINSLALSANYIFNILHLRGKIRLSFKNLKIKKHFKPLLFLLASSVAVELYTAVDITMLGFMTNDSIVGYYNNAIKIVKIVQTLISAISVVLLPRLSYLYSNSDKTKFNSLFNRSLKFLMALSLPASAGLFILSGPIIEVLYSSEFAGSIMTLRILSITLPLLVLNVLFGAQCLIASGNEKKYLITVVIGACVNIILNPIFIHFYEQNGAAIASVISELSVSVSSIIFAKSIVKLELDWKFLASTIFSTLFMMVTVYLFNLIPMNQLVSMLLSVLLGICIYTLCIILTKNDLINEIKTFVNKKKEKKL